MAGQLGDDVTDADAEQVPNEAKETSDNKAGFKSISKPQTTLPNTESDDLDGEPMALDADIDGVPLTIDGEALEIDGDAIPGLS